VGLVRYINNLKARMDGGNTMFCWHKWNKWEELPKESWTRSWELLAKADEKFNRYPVKRVCSKCGKVERKFIGE
jgi:hypothetical protein